MSFTKLDRGRRAKGIPEPLLFQTQIKSKQIVFSASLPSAVIEEMAGELIFLLSMTSSVKIHGLHLTPLYLSGRNLNIQAYPPTFILNIHLYFPGYDKAN